MLRQLAMDSSGGLIGVFGQQQSMPAAIHVRHVNAAIGTHEAVTSLSYQHTVLSADQAFAFTNREFRYAWVDMKSFTPGAGCRGRTNRVQINEFSLSLRDDLVFQNEDVSRPEVQLCLT